MARLKVLFADDQIPDEDIPDSDIISVMMKRYPNDPDFVQAFWEMRQTVKTLRDGGYDVSIANTKRKALNLIKATHFDIAIVDLMWVDDEDVPLAKRDNAGWEICDAIEEADRKATNTPTFQIICSSRFAEKPDIAMTAAQRSKLPVFKSYNEAGSQSLLASLNFIEKYMPSPREVVLNEVKDYWKMAQKALNEAQIQERRWSAITIVLVALSVILILVGALAALFGYAQAGTLTSISSVITSAVSILLFRQLNKMQENTRNRLKNVEQNFRDTMEQLKETEPKR
jgi:CheY-like chemotaxis protein